MNSDPGKLEENPYAVIMARGESRRMGRPKGLCRVPGGRGSFIAAISRLYDQAGIAVAVVTTDSGRRDYQEALPAEVSVVWAVGPAGQDTAWTVQLAWRILRGRASQLWLHPVDMPLVELETIREMKRESEGHTGSILRPVQQGRPGHPVVLPAEALDALAPLWSDQPSGVPGPMRDWLTMAVQEGLIPNPILVPVTDEGTIRDFDQPGDVDPGKLAERRLEDGN